MPNASYAPARIKAIYSPEQSHSLKYPSHDEHLEVTPLISLPISHLSLPPAQSDLKMDGDKVMEGEVEEEDWDAEAELYWDRMRSHFGEEGYVR